MKRSMNRSMNRRELLRKSITVSAAAGATLLLTACGQKGPLYIPGDDDQKKKKKKSS